MEEEGEVERVIRELSKARGSRGGKRRTKEEQQNNTRCALVRTKIYKERKNQKEIKVGKANNVEKRIHSDFSDK